LNTYIFNVWACVYGDDVTVLNSEVVTNDSVETSATIIKLVIGEDDQNSILPLLAFYEDGITTKQTKGFHGLVGQTDNRVIIVGGIGNDQGVWLLLFLEDSCGYFIFLK